MDSETALGFVKHGATLLLLDVPQYTLVGIDTQVNHNAVFGSRGSVGKLQETEIFDWSLQNKGQVLWSRNCSRFCNPESSKYCRHEISLEANGRRLLVTSGSVRAPICQVQGHRNGLRTLPHTAAITTVDWHPTLPIFLTGSADHSVRMFSVGPAFKGIKMIPPGPHFVYYSSSNRDGNEFSPIIGFFIDACPSEVIVRKWDQQEERLVKLSEEEEERYCQAVKSLEFDGQLGPYTLSQYGDWKRLSNYITKSTIERIEPIGGEITVACEPGMIGNIPRTAMEKALAEQLRTSKFSTSVDKSQRRGCYYTSIPRFIKRKGICGQELTSLNLDKTQLLESILIKDYGGAEDLLLGELQFAFIAFLMGQSLEAFLQWKSLVSLLFGCTEAPFRTRTQLFTKFIKVIYYQLKYGLQKDRADMSGAEKGASALLDDSWLSADSFLHHLCKDFFSLVQDASVVDGELLSWTRKLKELLENNLGWEFQQSSAVDGMYLENDDEFAPVVEMLDDPSCNEASAG